MSLQLKKVLGDLPLPMDLGWSKELGAGDFSGALAKIDNRLAEEPTDLAARLWWVQCQSELGIVPASALNSPLEELLPKLKEANHLYESSIAAFVRVSIRLLDRNQTKLAVVLIERAYDFSKLGRSVPEETRELLRESLSEALVQERERAELKREPKIYLDSIDKKLAELKSVKKTKPVERARKKTGSNLSSASLLRDAVENGKEEKDETEIDEPLIQEGLGGDRHARQAALIAICGFLMIIFGLYSSRIFDSSTEQYNELLAVSLLPSSYPQLQTVSLSFAEAKTVGWESVSKRLERLKEAKTITWNAEKSANEREVPRPTVVPTEVISREDKSKLPEMNPDKLATAVVESLGDSGATNPVGKVTRGPDGRIYGPPPTDPSVRPVEVEQMKTPQLYRVIAPTAVFSAPSVIAQSVARLEPNAKIQVVAKLGKWLELRSSGGRRGYIYAQDAELERKP